MAESKKSKYASIICKSKDAKDAAKQEERVEDARIQLDADIHAAKKEVNQANRSVEAAIAADYFDSADIIEAKQELELAQANYEALLDLQKELF